MLAIEPDADQALSLERTLSARVGGRLVIVTSTEAALSSLDASIPDLVLVSPLLPPKSEDRLVEHLRSLGTDASHVQVLTIPRVREGNVGAEKPRLFRRVGKRSNADPANDSLTFADEVASYLEQVVAARSETEATPEEIEDVATPDSLAGVGIEHIEQLLARVQVDEPPQPQDERPDEDTMTNHSDTASVPRFLTLDPMVPAPLRALLAEADGCLQMSFFTGGGACAGRAVDVLLSEQRMTDGDRVHQLRELGKKHPAVGETFLRALLQVTTTSGAPWDAKRLTLAITLLKAIAYEIYVLGPERVERTAYVIDMFEKFSPTAKTSAAV